MSISWQCPYCNHHSIINQNNVSSGGIRSNDNSKFGNLFIEIGTITCPNESCKELIVRAELKELKRTHPSNSYGKVLYKWKLRPQSFAKPLPEYIPKAITEDYEEACLIQGLSPKASATLSRRCLQGIIRDFWEVTPQNLAKEIEAIKDEIDPTVWEAIDVVRKIGNIGAHMEKDINQIVEVDENEAGLLIGLIETLIEEWYINRYNREQRLAKIKQLGQDKEAEKQKLKESKD